ncbi:MAG: hypothetical protein E3J37_07245 [Anaerolineales bacterium]|nr:MAG: hypothetical protein E3J37_07245 [Anaerolineales bacterium]
MPIESIVISQNPVTAWEIYSRNLYPKAVGRPSDFFQLDRTKVADGGYGRLRFKFRGTRPELESFFEYGLGRDIKIYNQKGLVDYHGFVFSLILNTGVHILRKSMQHIFNKVWARFDATGGVDPTQRSTVYQNTASQTRFGIIEHVIGGGQQSAAAAINQAVQNKLSWYAWPMIDMDYDAGRGDPYIEIIADGYQRTLAWRTYNQTAAGGDDNLSTIAAAIITACGQFVASTDITTNTIQVPKEYDNDRKAKDVLESLAGMGDASGNRWLSRVEADRIYSLGPITNVRFRYSINVWDKDKQMIDRDGSIVSPDEIEPNEGIRLIGSARPTSEVYDSDLETPYISFVENVSYRYDANKVKVRATKESMLQSFLKRLGGMVS